MKKITLLVIALILTSFTTHKERWDENKDCWSPLMTAIYKNKIKKFEKLIKSKRGITYVSTCDNSNWELTPLEVAIRCKNAYAVELLMQTGEYLNLDEHLLTACDYESVHIVELLIQYGGNVNYIDGDNFTVLMSAALGDIAILKTILKYNCKIVNERRTIDGMTSLMLCAYNKDVEKVKLLLEYNADKGIKDSKDRTALEYVDFPYRDDIDSKDNFEKEKLELKELLK